MPLPKIEQPLFERTIPSTEKKIIYRPFLVREEKILLMAQQSGNAMDIIRALKQIITNCVQDNIDVDALATFDLEYMFLILRSTSVNNIVNLSYRDNEDDQVYKFDVDLNDIKIIKDPANNPNIQISDTIGIKLRYPNVNLTESIDQYETEADILSYFITNCIESIYDANSVYLASDYTKEELDEFFDGLDIKTFEKVKLFFDTMPKMRYTIKYQNSLGHDREIELSTLQDFFTLG